MTIQEAFRQLELTDSISCSKEEWIDHLRSQLQIESGKKITNGEYLLGKKGMLEVKKLDKKFGLVIKDY